MTLFGYIVLAFGGVSAFVGFLVALLKKGAQMQGAREERDAETIRSDAAKARADEVLAESRNPDDAVDRLRRGDF